MKTIQIKASNFGMGGSSMTTQDLAKEADMMRKTKHAHIISLEEVRYNERMLVSVGLCY